MTQDRTQSGPREQDI